MITSNNQNMSIFLAVSLFTLLWYAWLLYKYSKKSDPKTPPSPPGPKGLPILGSLPFLDPELHSHFAKLAQEHGPIFSLKLGNKTSIVITSPAAAREVLKQHDVVFANRPVPTVVTAMEYGGHDIVFTPYGPEWRMLRKVCVRDMLGHTTLDAFYSYRRREVRSLVKYLYGSKGGAVDIGEQMFLGVLNVITNMLWGGTIEGGGRGGDGGRGAEFREVVAEITELLGKPNLSDVFPGMAWMDLQGMKKKMKRVVVKLERIFDEIIGERMGGGEKGEFGRESKDFLQVLLRLRSGGGAGTEIPMTMSHVKALLLDMVVGGTDTTSSAVEFALTEMMNKPQVMLKAQQELDTVIGRSNVVEESHATKLPYLSAIMKETLRLHPSLPLMVPHCPSKPCTVANYAVPEGARVFVNVWAIHRDPSIWENPSDFIPERFLEGKGWDYSGSDFSYLPFGSGRRSCAGIAMAERIVMYSLASLVHSFEWKLAEGERVDLSEKFGIVLKKRVPLVVVPVPRLSGEHLYQ